MVKYTLIIEYLSKGNNFSQVATLCGCSRTTVPKAIFGNGNLFMLRAKGDSMIDAGIKDDDLIVIRKQNTAENGDIIVAMMNGETTLKRFYKRNGKVVLHPENKEMKDIIVKDCEIQGVLVSCIHIYN